MPWYVCIVYFFGGAFLCNAIPHFVMGVCGKKFPTPFAKPPGKGLSSPWVNVLWGFSNLAAAYLLILKVGDFDPRNWAQAGLAGAGILLIGVQSAVYFGRSK